MTDPTLTESLAALTEFFVGDGTLEETLTRVSDLTVEAVPSADVVGITMPLEGHKRTAFYTDETSPAVDQAQYDTGDGPCLEAFRDQRVVAVESTKEDGDWPAFRRTAVEHGIFSTLSFPLVAAKRSVGAMNLYARRERAFDDADVERGRLFASQAAIVLANAQAYWDARDLSTQLGEALANRAVIEQAKGILIAAQGCDEDEAFQVLAKASQRENVKLRLVARRIVDNAKARRTDGTRRPTPPP